MPYRKPLFRLAPLALAAHLLMAGPAAAQSAPGTQGPLVPAPNPALAAQIDQRAKAIEDKLIAWRRDIHEHPELGNQENRTAKLVADHLRALGMEVKTGVAGTGVVAVLKGGKPGPVVALRADMDALPVKEQVDLPFASKAKGTYLGKEVDVMHACGHDTHTAILMATAEVLAGMKDQLPGSVKFIFQPAEESPADFEPDGKKIWGAKMMVQEGVLENPKVDAIFGLHVSSAYPAGKLSWRSGPAMAAADQFWIDVTVGAIHGGNRMNIVPDNVAMTGTIRTYDEGMKKDIHQRIARTADMIAQSAGAKADVRVVELYNATVNNPALTEQMGPTLRRVAGEGNYGLQPKSTASEDFSFYQEKVPGMFFYLGVTPKGTDVEKAAPNHSPRFYVDESGLINGVRALSNLTVDYMAQAQKGS
jgi:amidohydrolase